MQRTVTCTAEITGSGVMDAYGAYLQVTGVTPQCTSDEQCSDGLYCTGTEVCLSGTCRAGTPVSCNDGNSCTDDACTEESKSCSNVWKPCGISDSCCGPTCTAPTDTDCSAPQQCWKGSYNYLYNNPIQAKKFCKCASGIYGSFRYTPSLIRKAIAYRYVDTGNNTNWEAISVSSKYPIQSVLCPNGTLYPTNVNYTW